LFRVTGDERYLDRARQTAKFLLDHAWDERLATFPFEHPSPSPDSMHHAYFFDCGIIIRGLMAVWRETQDDRLIEVARAASLGMIADFHSGADYHPILELPSKEALTRTEKWSRSPGCYQLKAALAWWEVAEVTGADQLRDAFFELLDAAVSTHESYLPGTQNSHEIMDRLHPYAYFLEGLTPFLDRPDCYKAFAQGLCSISRYLREIAPSFVRSDVYAQLLRARILGADAVGIDKAAAANEAEALIAFQTQSEDARIDGGFVFGRRNGEISPHVNPVSTSFALQALQMWSEYKAEGELLCRNLLI
jgi:hypothetical protein